jgi:Xaa-Pro aminopeptidase
MLYNKDRLLALMDKHDLAGVVAATPENVYYLSGHASWSQNGYRYGGSQVYVVFPRDPGQSPALLIPGGDVGYAALDDVWLKEIYTYGVAVTSVDAFFENTGRRGLSQFDMDVSETSLEFGCRQSTPA